MKGDLRRERMLKLIRERGGMAARELAEHFGVSRMTVHRDLLQLEREAWISRLHGGVISVAGETRQLCRSCEQGLIPHQQVDGYCCAHCALKNSPKPSSLSFHDFISGRPLAASECFFLMNSMVDICCRPTMLTFAEEAEVISFRLGFGGVIGRLTEALEFLQLERELADRSASP